MGNVIIGPATLADGAPGIRLHCPACDTDLGSWPCLGLQDVQQQVAAHEGELYNQPPRVEGISWTVGVGYVRAACQQCGWEKDVHNETRWHPELVFAARQHARTTHLPPGGRCSSEGCECGDNC